MKTILHVLLVVAALAILAYPFGAALDAVYGSEVYLLSGLNDQATVELNRELLDPSLEGAARTAAVIEIYGSSPDLATERVLLFDDTHVIHPVEMPELALLPAGSAGGAYPAQSQSLLYVTQSITIAGFVGAVVLLLARRLVVGGG